MSACCRTVRQCVGARLFRAPGTQEMMTVPTYVGPSEIEGVGVFAAAPIKKGDSVWRFDTRFDLLLSVSDILSLSEVQQAFITRYSYSHLVRPDLVIIEFDHGRFMNHSTDPNTDFTDPDVGLATRDIAEGEEMTCNYADFEPQFVMLPGRQFVTAAQPSAAPNGSGSQGEMSA
ncbi:MAG TPA: SET domain-containing protein-lysine N-methyltransferase [Sphingomonadaceae bacterium]|nr:SET domain-containing protein-lysine N-methyltransferase [Sphingomonadaceae bacterium]